MLAAGARALLPRCHAPRPACGAQGLVDRVHAPARRQPPRLQQRVWRLVHAPVSQLLLRPVRHPGAVQGLVQRGLVLQACGGASRGGGKRGHGALETRGQVFRGGTRARWPTRFGTAAPAHAGAPPAAAWQDRASTTSRQLPPPTTEARRTGQCLGHVAGRGVAAVRSAAPHHIGAQPRQQGLVRARPVGRRGTGKRASGGGRQQAGVPQHVAHALLGEQQGASERWGASTSLCARARAASRTRCSARPSGACRLAGHLLAEAQHGLQHAPHQQAGRAVGGGAQVEDVGAGPVPGRRVTRRTRGAGAGSGQPVGSAASNPRASRTGGAAALCRGPSGTPPTDAVRVVPRTARSRTPGRPCGGGGCVWRGSGPPGRTGPAACAPAPCRGGRVAVQGALPSARDACRSPACITARARAPARPEACMQQGPRLGCRRRR
jgi:hypothetical protein